MHELTEELVDAESQVSSAILTPHLIHPNFWEYRGFRVPRAIILRIGSIREDEKNFRREWCARQLEQLKHNPSNAVIK